MLAVVEKSRISTVRRGRVARELNPRYDYHFHVRHLSLSVLHKVALGLGLLAALEVCGQRRRRNSATSPTVLELGEK